MYHNVVIGEPLIEIWKLLSNSEKEYEEFDKQNTLFTQERYLPAILKQSGVVSSISEVRRNKPKLCKNLENIDCQWVKWGKHKIYIIIGK